MSGVGKTSRRDEQAGPRLLLAFDKFRGTINARDLTERLHTHFAGARLQVDVQALSDGGEGFLDAFDGDVMTAVVPGPLGDDVTAPFLLRPSKHGPVAVMAVANVVGYQQLVRASHRQALDARSDGVGHLILSAARAGAQSVLIGCGGSVTSDGGRGCYEVLQSAGGLPVPTRVATDVTTNFLGARRYASQKNVSDSDLRVVDRRLEDLRARYLQEQGRDVGTLKRGGAAGGIAGALAALGATLIDGFDVVSHELNLVSRVNRASVVVTGEGRFDFGSLEGKATLRVAQLVPGASKLLLVCGQVEPGAAKAFQAEFATSTLVSLEERLGPELARRNVASNIAAVIEEYLARSAD
ncbi:MAG TPA: glycerate kinase [Acidimicrobiales bacterium]|nr:glycerate kinase [Acidimicrobiales bacterium]